MKNEYRKALYEVYVVLEHTNEEIKNRIPEKFIEFIKENMDKSHEFYLKENIRLEKQDLMIEAKQILALIYRDYICSEDEREKLIIKEKEKQNKKEEENEEKYNINFKKNADNKKDSIKEIKENQENSLIKIAKEKWYKRLINKILTILKINN